MEDKNTKRKLAAIFSADAKDYTRLMRDNEAETVATITEYRKLMAALILQHHGRVVDSTGDNLLAEFSSVVDAVQGAVAIQKELKVKNNQLPDHRKMEFRIGINLGDVIVIDDRIYGDGVNIAARLEKFADAGGICISRTAYDQIEDKLPLGYEYIGEHTAKNIQKPLKAYKVNIWSDQPSKGPDSIFVKNKAQTFQRQSGFSKKHQTGKARHSSSNSKSEHLLTHQKFKYHLKVYLGIIGFLCLINILTYADVIWFHWPAMGWGIALYLHWLRVSYSKKK